MLNKNSHQPLGIKDKVISTGLLISERKTDHKQISKLQMHLTDKGFTVSFVVFFSVSTFVYERLITTYTATNSKKLWKSYQFLYH